MVVGCYFCTVHRLFIHAFIQPIILSNHFLKVDTRGLSVYANSDFIECKIPRLSTQMTKGHFDSYVDLGMIVWRHNIGY